MHDEANGPQCIRNHLKPFGADWTPEAIWNHLSLRRPSVATTTEIGTATKTGTLAFSLRAKVLEPVCGLSCDACLQPPKFLGQFADFHLTFAVSLQIAWAGLWIFI